MFIAGLGAIFFGCAIGWIAYRILRQRASAAALSDFFTILGVIGGAAVIALFKSDVLFGLYAVGLVIGFFAYLAVGLVLYGKQELQPWRIEQIPPKCGCRECKGIIKPIIEEIKDLKCESYRCRKCKLRPLPCYTMVERSEARDGHVDENRLLSFHGSLFSPKPLARDNGSSMRISTGNGTFVQLTYLDEIRSDDAVKPKS